MPHSALVSHQTREGSEEQIPCSQSDLWMNRKGLEAETESHLSSLHQDQSLTDLSMNQIGSLGERSPTSEIFVFLEYGFVLRASKFVVATQVISVSKM